MWISLRFFFSYMRIIYIKIFYTNFPLLILYFLISDILSIYSSWKMENNFVENVDKEGNNQANR